MGDMPPSDVEKRLKLMRYWLVGTFIIVFAGSAFYSGYIGSIAGDPIGGMLRYGGIVWVIAAVLCVAAYYGYKNWVAKQ